MRGPSRLIARAVVVLAAAVLAVWVAFELVKRL